MLFCPLYLKKLKSRQQDWENISRELAKLSITLLSKLCMRVFQRLFFSRGSPQRSRKRSAVTGCPYRADVQGSTVSK